MEEFEDWGDTEVKAPAPTQDFEDWGDAPAEASKGSLQPESLQTPTPNMFARMADEDAKVAYEAYKNHPNSKVSEDGSIVYDGIPVPPPEGNSWLVDTAADAVGKVVQYGTPMGLAATAMGNGEVFNDVGRGLEGGAINAAKDTITGLNAFVPSPMDLIAKTGLIEGRDKDADQKTLQDTLPEFNSEGSVEGASSVTSQIGLGIAGGNKLTATKNTVEMLASKLPTAIQGLSKMLVRNVGGAAGAALTTATDDNLMVGKDALIPIADGLESLDKGTQEGVINQRMNTFIDGMLFAAPLEVITTFGKSASDVFMRSFVLPVADAFSDKRQAQAVGNAIMNKLAVITNRSTPEEIEELRIELVDLLKDPKVKQIFFDLTPDKLGKVEVDLDTVTALERAFADHPNPLAKKIISALRAERAEIAGNVSKGIKTRTAMEAPQARLEDLLQESEETFGGAGKISEGIDAIQRQGQEEVGSVVARSEEAGMNLDRAKEALPDAVRQEGDLGKALFRSQTEPGSKMFEETDRLLRETSDTIDEGTGKIKKQNEENWKGIREGASVSETFPRDLEDARPYLPKSLQREIDKIGEEGWDFGRLQQLRKPLSDAVNNLKGSIGFDEVRALRDNLVKEQPEFLRESAAYAKSQKKGAGNLTGAADDLEKAETYFKDVRAPARQGVVKDIEESASKNRFDEPTRLDENFAAIESGLKKPNTVEHTRKILSSPEFGGKEELVDRLVVAKIVDNLRNQIRSEGLGELGVDNLLSTISAERRAAAGSPKLQKELDGLEALVIKHKGDVKKLEGIFEQSAKDATAAEDEVYGEVLNNFFYKSGKKKGGGFEAFEAEMNKPDAVANIKNLVKKSKDPDTVRDALRVAYAKFYRKQALTASKTPGDVSEISSTKVRDILEENNNVKELGKFIFGDDVMQAVEELTAPAYKAARTKGLKGEVSNPGISEKTAKAAQSRLTNILIGPLTRTGARVGGFTSAALQWAMPNEAIGLIRDEIFSDPQAMANLLAKTKLSGLKDRKVYRDIFSFLVRAGVYPENSYDDWQKEVDSLETEAQTEEAIPADKR